MSRAWCVALLTSMTCAGVAACASPSATYRQFDEVPYGYPGERSVWAPRAGMWIQMAELPSSTTSTRTPVLLVHPWSTNMLVWREVAPKLARDRRVVLLDLPGHGKSGKPPGRYPIRRLAAAALDVLDAARIDRAIVIGNSIGGATSIELALVAPERVRALVLLDAPGGTKVAAPLASIVERATVPRALATLNEASYAISWRVVTPSMPPLAEQIRDANAALLGTPEHALWARATSASLAEVVRWSPPLERVRAPTLVVHGDDDLVVPKRSAEALLARIPGAERAWIAACGHMPEIECPAVLLEKVGAFLARH